MDPVVHPVIAEHGSFAHVRLGKHAPVEDTRTLRLAAYLDDEVVLPEIPESVDYSVAVAGNWPMFGNNTLGDCTIAAAAHMVEAWSANASTIVVPDEADVIRAYWETGEPPAEAGEAGGPTDDGRNELGVLNYWHKAGIAGDKIEAFASIDPQNLDHVRAAIYLFGGVYTGIALPLSAQGQSRWDVEGDGKTGNAQPDSWGGHAVPYVAYGPTAVSLVTWGDVLVASNEFHLAYCDEAYCVVSKDWLTAKGDSINGFSLGDLLSDVKALTQS